MKNIKMVTAILLSCSIAASATACSQADGTPAQKDYSSAPHYADLVAWFDSWDYTEEQRESFLKDTVTCDRILFHTLRLEWSPTV